MKTTDTGIESALIDLSSVSFASLRGLDSSAVHQAMHHALERTGNLHNKQTGDSGQGERVD